ncbi:polyamine ABC transporter substrate-binding protein [Chromobacterium sp. Panama]|uniref:polyamine ABC transporter substrate-binding protein n=1 Tax=Chromobacterium sp. Panama TaxID=2161826 RepID=UPI000D3127D1|nr:polyamine ABC transporter substrate-binding protein [Chromobacterium sp. Panama]PTU65215.1 polyamine ABC transporter substrate-binding protein [Chromobacterium sp. Panama]
MEKWTTRSRTAFARAGLLLSGLLTAPVHAGEILNVYNWSDYIAKDTIANFEKQQNAKVRYDNYDSNTTLEAKLLLGNAGYDVVVPTSNFLARQIKTGIYQKLDKSKIGNLKHLDPVLMKLIEGADPGNLYGVPWAYVTVGIGYNQQKVSQALGSDVKMNSWAVLFNPQLAAKVSKCGLSVVDGPVNVFAAALQYLGRDPSSANPKDYEDAYALLKKVRPYISRFNTSGYINDLANGDICVALGFSGDVYIASKRASEAKKPYSIRFANVREGGLLAFDVMAIPKDAKNPALAMKWVNYIEDPKVNAAITNETFYPTANKAARKYVNPALLNDPILYPPEAELKNMTLIKPLPQSIMSLQSRLWSRLKINK